MTHNSRPDEGKIFRRAGVSHFHPVKPLGLRGLLLRDLIDTPQKTIMPPAERHAEIHSKKEGFKWSKKKKKMKRTTTGTRKNKIAA